MTKLGCPEGVLLSYFHEMELKRRTIFVEVGVESLLRMGKDNDDRDVDQQPMALQLLKLWLRSLLRPSRIEEIAGAEYFDGEH